MVVALAGICLAASSAARSAEPAIAPQGQSGTGSSDSSTAIHALGKLEPASGLITIGARPGARVERIAVHANDKVEAGAILAILEGHSQAKAQLDLALAQKARAGHERSVKKRQLELERERFDKIQTSKLESARRVFGSKQRWNEIAEIYKQLMDEKNLAARDRLDVMLRYFEAENQNLQGELEIASFTAAQSLVKRQRELEDEQLGDKGPDQDLLDRQVDLAHAGVAMAEVHAPFAGEVLELIAHEGEVSNGALLLFGDTTSMVAVAEVYQADLLRLRPNAPATVKVLDQSVNGQVTSIGTVIGKNQMVSLDPRALQDRRVAKVTVKLDDPTVARRLLNMEVDVVIRPAAGSPGDSSGQASR